MSRIITFLKKKDLYLGIVRYALGLIMITYGISKILRTQFVVIPFALWQRPLETISGRTLAWAFLGYSPWFQVLLGFLELIPALLLLFRRTTFIGALLLLPMTLNVFLINHALNLWADTKMISLVLLTLNILVLIFEWVRVKAVFLLIIGKGKKFKFTLAEVIFNVVAAAVVLYLSSQWLWDYRKQVNKLTGDWYNQRPAEWVLKSEIAGKDTAPHKTVKMYFGAFGEFSEINDTGYVKRNTMTYELNEKKHVLNFYNANNKLMDKYDYNFEGDSILILQKPSLQQSNTMLVQVFKKRVIHAGAYWSRVMPSGIYYNLHRIFILAF